MKKFLITYSITLFIVCLSSAAWADSAKEISSQSHTALSSLLSKDSSAKALSGSAKAVLVFPDILKAGLIIGGQYGEGALIVGGKTSGYYSSGAVSYGLQAGAQTFGYAMFFMNDEALKYLDESNGWEVGTGPTVVVADEGFSSSFSTSSLKDDIYVYFFDQEGLMLGLGIQGTKITKITPD